MARRLNGGDTGRFTDVTCVPDATLATEITALVALGTVVEGSKLVSNTFSNNCEVTSPADGAIPDGRIMTVEKDATNTYLLTVRMWSYVDTNAARHSSPVLVYLPYDTALALHDSVVIDGSTYMYVKDGTSGGFGAVWDLDTTNEEVGVLI